MKKTLLFILVSSSLLTACGIFQKSQSRQDETYNIPLRREQPRERNVPARVSEVQQQNVLPPLTRRLDSLLITADTLLQRTQLGLHVIDLTTGEELYARNPHHRMRPASTEKVVTAIAALDLLGPNYTLDTQLLTTAPVNKHTLNGDIYIKGVMDPLFRDADIRSLVAQLKAAGITRINGHLVADASMKDADEFGWGWCWDDDNPTLSPLLVGGKPGLAAQLRAAMRKAGITLGKGINKGTAPASARCIAAIRRPLTEVLKPMLKESDNLCAEAVFYQMGKTRKDIAQRISELVGSGPSIADGSGLSLYNYQTPATFTSLLAYATVNADSIFTPLMEALPIAAVDGTLKNRMADTPAAANVHAKTGSVTAVSTLVGYLTQRSTDHLIAFAILNNGLPRMAEGRALQDKICIILSE